jgi:hypothetical protein
LVGVVARVRALARRQGEVLPLDAKALPAAVAPEVRVVATAVVQVVLAAAVAPGAVVQVLAVVLVVSPVVLVAVAVRPQGRSVAAAASSAAASRESNAVKSSTTLTHPRSVACRFRADRARAFAFLAGHR